MDPGALLRDRGEAVESVSRCVLSGREVGNMRVDGDMCQLYSGAHNLYGENMTSAPTLNHERVHFALGAIAGLDEVGRGALAGPVMVGAVVLRSEKELPEELRDSKLLTPKRREVLAPRLREWADDWAVGSASNVEIDAWGIRLALAVAADRALAALTIQPHHLMIDGPLNLLHAPSNVPIGVELPPTITFSRVPATMLVKGDQVSAAIAAAAVIAKVERDDLMQRLAIEFPEYGWDGNKGYGSAGHREAIVRCGPSPHHRISWNLI